MSCVQTYKVFLTLCTAFILDFTASVKEDKQGRRTICLRGWYQFSIVIRICYKCTALCVSNETENLVRLYPL